MMHKVMIPDGHDWNITYFHCTEWIRETYPDYRRAVVGNDDYEWDSDFAFRHIVFLFKDPAAAMLFKLTFGGGVYTIKR